MANMKPREKQNRIARLVERDGPLCGISGGPLGDDITIDHIVPKSQGALGDGRSANNLDNLRLAHEKCNYERHHGEGSWRPKG